MLKNLAKTILTVFIVFAAIFVASNVYQNKKFSFDLKPIELTIRQGLSKLGLGGLASKRGGCEEVVQYSLGNIDKNFGLSREQFLKAVKEAEAMWESGSGKDLFNYSDTGALAVNLVFDERQANTNRLNDILSKINGDEAKLNAVKAEYSKLTAQVKAREASFKLSLAEYEKAQSNFNTRVSDYNAKTAEYSRQVEFWNKKGGAPEEEFKKLTTEKAAIDALFASLNPEQEALKRKFNALEAQKSELNDLISQVNTVAGIFNRLAENINVRVDLYNEVGGVGEEFVSGLYTSNQAGEKIDIFQFYNNQDLVATIAHELGHALGIGHASSSSSIMHARSQGQKTKLGREDLDMLNALCTQ